MGRPSMGLVRVHVGLPVDVVGSIDALCGEDGRAAWIRETITLRLGGSAVPKPSVARQEGRPYSSMEVASIRSDLQAINREVAEASARAKEAAPKKPAPVDLSASAIQMANCFDGFPRGAKDLMIRTGFDIETTNRTIAELVEAGRIVKRADKKYDLIPDRSE